MATPREAILALAAERGAQSSFCPSDAARLVNPETWRSHLTATRAAAIGLAAEGRIEILRKGKPVAPDGVRGVIRLRALAADNQG